MQNFGLIDLKQKGSELIRYLADCMIFPFDTPDLDLEVSKSVFENAFISGMGGLIDMKWMACESSIHDHDIDVFVTIVGWVDVCVCVNVCV